MLGPPVADGDPSPKSHAYVSVDWSSVPGSIALPLKATGRPHAAVVSGPAFVAGARLSMVTEKVVVEVSPVASVAVELAAVDAGSLERVLRRLAERDAAVREVPAKGREAARRRRSGAIERHRCALDAGVRAARDDGRRDVVLGEGSEGHFLGGRRHVEGNVCWIARLRAECPEREDVEVWHGGGWAADDLGLQGGRPGERIGRCIVVGGQAVGDRVARRFGAREVRRIQRRSKGTIRARSGRCWTVRCHPGPRSGGRSGPRRCSRQGSG